MKTIKTLTVIALAAVIAFAFTGCSQDAGDPPAHVHAYSDSWTSNETHHWHAADCGIPVHNKDLSLHIEDSGTVTKNVELGTDGARIYKCTVCGNERIEPITKPKLYETPVDAETGLPATKSSRYIYFGVFPKTVLPVGSTVTVNETVSVKMGADTYYKGNDGEYYAKVMENANQSDSSINMYSDGTQAKKSDAESYRYFKVEPIKWKVITDSYSGKCLLLAEDILTANVPYYKYNSLSNRRTVGSDTGIFSNNYKYSQIRAYLNGLDYYYDESSTSTVKKNDYTGKGFLQTAFTDSAQSLIATTTVDNSAASTTDSGNNLDKATETACADTEDKIFLLSIKEATSYGFLAYDKWDNARIRKATDYAKANYAYHDGPDSVWWGSDWCLRSPCNGGRGARQVSNSGHTEYGCDSNSSSYGVVPALCLELK